MKRKVVFCESDSESELENNIKKVGSVSKKAKVKPSPKANFNPDIFDDESSSKRIVQLSLVDSLMKQQEINKKEKKVKTLDSYFSPNNQAKDKPFSKKLISVDDFFGDKKSNVTTPKKQNIKTPTNSPANFVPDTPLVTLNSSLHITESPIPDTPNDVDQFTTPKKSSKLNKSCTVTPPTKTFETDTNATPQDRKSFWAFKNREGPKSLGSRPIPKGTKTCLQSLNFVITGVLEYVERDEASQMIERCGGKVMKTLGKRTHYLVVGREPGPGKLTKAENLKIKKINEDELFEMIEQSSEKENNTGTEVKQTTPKKLQSPLEKKRRVLSPMKTIKKESTNKKPSPIMVQRSESTNKKSPPIKLKTDDLTNQKSSSTKIKKSELIDAGLPIVKSKNKMLTNQNKGPIKSKNDVLSKPVQALDDDCSLTARPVICSDALSNQKMAIGGRKNLPSSSELWSDKYRPINLRQLVGQGGQASPANKLFHWLSQWHANFKEGHKAKAYSSAPPWGSGSTDSGQWARAALLSGPPGIGKTTSAMIVCKELGFATCELNASDCRSKRFLGTEIRQSLGTQNLALMASGRASKLEKAHHVLIMDEVDGMAGNEDRGGMQELIGMIKSSQIPIICLCNDRQSTKVRSLANYCFDLRFHRPRVEQIKSHILSIACKENVSIPGHVLIEIIHAANQDIRQVVNNVQMWCTSGLADESQLNADTNGARKNVHLSAFDVIRKVFQPDISGPTGGPASFADSMDLFFQDYSLIPMFVQENYVNVKQRDIGDSKKQLEAYARAANDIAMGDIISHRIRSVGTGSWSLLPIQGLFSVVRPGRLLRGSLPGGPAGVTFPSWFGKNSTHGRLSRICADLASHLRLSTHSGSTNSRSLALDHMTAMAELFTRPLKEGDVESTVQLLIRYQLTRDDFDSIMELSSWSMRPNRMSTIDAKVKSAMTRALNKSSYLLPYSNLSTSAVRQKRVHTTTAAETEDGVDEDAGLFDEADETNEEGDFKNDAMITVKKESSIGSKKRKIKEDVPKPTSSKSKKGSSTNESKKRSK